MPLVNCLECGYQVSSAARECPNCQTHFPLGRVCRVCLETSKASVGIVTYKGDDYSDSDWIDARCYNAIQREYQSIRYTCPACGNVAPCQTRLKGELVFPFFFSDGSAERAVCTRCGHPVDFQHWAQPCSQCHAYYFAFTAFPEWTGVHRNCAAAAYKIHQEKFMIDQENLGPPKQSGCLTSILFICLTLFMFLLLAKV